MIDVNISETILYDNIIKKIDSIKNKLVNLKNYTDTEEANKKIAYIEKLSLFSDEINNLEAMTEDMYNEFILQLEPDKLNNLDKNKIKNLIIEKKIQNTFTPYMLYLRVLLQNT